MMALVMALVMAIPADAQEPAVVAREDPAKIRTAEACGECHAAEHQVWEKTPHARGFTTLHRAPAAQAIADSMGIRLLKRDSLCLRCHYTPVLDDGELRAVSGVSCESCHGAGRDYIDVHNDYGSGAEHKTESAEHRAQRIAKSRAAGMRRPSDDLYAVANNCFGCHTVPEERLVNVGGHGTGSAGFELAAWSQGEIRHNFLRSFLDGDGTVNAEREPPRLRRLYVLGRALDLEHSLRGMAAATEPGVYAKAMSRRLRGALGEVRALARRAELPEIEAMIAAVRDVDAVPGNGAALTGAADRVGQAARGFLDRHDGTRLAAIDPLRLGTVADEPVVADEPSSPDGETVAAGGTVDGVGTTAAGPGSTSAAGAGTPSTTGGGGGSGGGGGVAAVAAVGTKKQRIRPPPQHNVIGPATCGGCHRHRDQNAWWLDDPHGLSIDPFYEEAAANVRIARLYGIKTGAMTQGDQICMDCHGTVISGRERREVQNGVGCESCHGAAEKYLDPHQEGDASLGKQRPGYVAALKLGMVELEDLAARARTCTGCHYITDSRLISSGHPSGRGFDYVGGMAKIRHWQHADASAAAVQAAIGTALGARGGVPDVPRARLASAGGGGTGSSAEVAGGGTAPSTGGAGTTSTSRGSVSSGGRRSRPRPPSARPVDPRSVPTPGEVDAVDLPPFPEIDGSTPIEEVLRLLQARLELLYAVVGKGEP